MRLGTEPNQRTPEGGAASGALWLGSVMPVAQVLRLGGDLLLVRLLSPKDFGVVALIGVMMNLTESLTQGGFDLSVTRSPSGDKAEFLNTVWTVQVIRGFVLWGVLLIAVWPISVFYAAPSLLYLLPVASLSTVLRGAASTSLLYLARHLSLKIPMLIFLGQQIVTVSVMLLWASISPSVWALVVGRLAGIAFMAALSHLAVRGMRVRFHWNRDAWHELLHFGKWIFAGNIVSSVATQLDDLILGKLAPLAVLGIYDISSKYPFLIQRAGSVCSRFLLLPILSRHHSQEPERFRERVAETRGTFSLIGIAPILFLFFYGPPYFGAFFPKDYASAGGTCQLLLITVWLCHIKFSAERVLLALGESRATAVATVWALLGSAIGLTGGFALAGMTGFAVGLAIGPLLSYLYVQFILARHGFPIIGQDLRYTGFVVGLALLGGVLPNAVLSHLDAGIRSEAVLVSSTVVMAVFLAVAGLHVWRTFSARRA